MTRNDVFRTIKVTLHLGRQRTGPVTAMQTTVCVDLFVRGVRRTRALLPLGGGSVDVPEPFSDAEVLRLAAAELLRQADALDPPPRGARSGSPSGGHGGSSAERTGSTQTG